MAASEPIRHRHRAAWPPDDASRPPSAWRSADVRAPSTAGPAAQPARGNAWPAANAAPRSSGWPAAEAGGWPPADGGAHLDGPYGRADEDELPIVAAYMVARGRVSATPYNRTATVYGRPGDMAAVYGLDPAHLRVLDLVNVRPRAVAELAGLMNVPVVAVRVLLDELADRRLVAVTGPDGPPPSPAILTRALSGLRTI
jgi:hypothetical protein